LPWFASGGLLALGGIGSNTRNLELLFLVFPSLAFFGVALLADLRRNRRIINNISILALSAIINFALLFLFVSI
jgi:hypothetical protein